MPGNVPGNMPINMTPGKKSILLLMNGFGMEVPKSFNVYTAALMPSLAKLSNYYPFVSLFASGTEIGLNKGQLSSFRAGYLAFSSNGKPSKKSNAVQAQINANTFATNPVIANSINYAVEHKSRLHIFFSIGERTEEVQFQQLKTYAELAVQCGVKDICVHVFLGDNSVQNMKVSNLWIKNLKYHVLNFVPQMRIVSIAGRKYLTDAPKDQKIAYYRMIVSGVGEVWTNYEDTITKKYEGKENDDNMGGFLAVRENVLREYDSVMNFNYDNAVGAEYLDIIQKPAEFFPAGGKIPISVATNALFSVADNPNIPYAFESELPQHYFFETIPDDKKILLIADKDRLQYISKCLNGFRENFKPNVQVWPIEDKEKRFDLMCQYLAAYINQGVYDLIIADCELYNEQIEPKTMDQLRKNMTGVDNVLNVAYTRGMEKGYTLYATSFYGIKTKLLLTTTYEEVDFSQKTPFLVAGKDVSRTNTSLQIDGNITQVAQVMLRNLGVNVSAPLVGAKATEKVKKKMLPIIILILAIFAIFVVFALLYITGVI